MAAKGIPGMAVLMASAGAFIMYVGIRDIPVREGLREILTGNIPQGDQEAQKSAFTTAAIQTLAARAAGGGSGGGPDTAPASAGSLSGGTHPEFARKALQYLGVPYKWGGASPAGFDCSGLVQWVMRESGVPGNIPRTTYTQQPWRKLRTIPRSAIGAGDLAFWPGHVAIVMNSGQVVHAPRPGTSVKTAAIDAAGPPGHSPTFKRYTGSSGGSSGPPRMAV